MTYRPLEPRPKCVHCAKNEASRGRRGLCQACHRTRSIRRLYEPSQHTRSGNGVRKVKGPRLPPARPTDALPGSEMKIAVLAARAALGRELWHPDDAREAADVPVDLDALAFIPARQLEQRIA